jgi:peptidyl-prolyl cis-trans isomerase SurA
MRFAKFLMLILPILFLVSCTTEHSKIIVAEFGNNNITMEEFEKDYAKNSGGFENAKKDSITAYKNFLDLFVNYKMKLRDAEVRGYGKDADMQKEFDDYKANIGTTLFLEKEFYEPNLKALYERRKTEYRASHIFLNEDSTRNKQQTEAFAKELIARLAKGEDFAKLAAQYSKDIYTAKDGGDVYYQVAGKIKIPALEDALYALEAGQVYPEPVWSGYGYHVLKVTDKRPRRAAIKVSHIMVQYNDSTGKADTARALGLIKEYEGKLKAGEDFGTLAKKYSADKASGANNGDIGFIDHSMMVKEFDEAAFKLKPGEISPIVKTRYGFHIIKLTEEKPYPQYADDRETLKGLFQETRYKLEYVKFTGKLLKDLNFVVNADTKKKVLGNSDTLKIGIDYPTSKLKAVAGSEAIFSYGAKNISVDSLFYFIKRKAEGSPQRMDERTLDEFITQYSQDLVIRDKAMSFDLVNPEFSSLMKEYRNGMYLFKILDEEVWSRINIDSVATKNFWDKNKSKFQWGNRVEFKETHVAADSIMKKITSSLSSGISFDTLYTKYNQRSGFENKPGYYGLVDVEYNQLAKEANKLVKPGDVSKPFEFENAFSIVKLIKKETARLKSFDEAKAESASMLQDAESKRLETEYLNKLKNLYKPKLNYDELSKAYKQ